jgi:hypothetical protein
MRGGRRGELSCRAVDARDCGNGRRAVEPIGCRRGGVRAVQPGAAFSAGGELVLVELEQVVGGREQPQFGSDGRPAAALEAVRAAVGLDLAQDGLDRSLALEIQLLAPVGRQDAPREVIRAAAPAGPWLFEPALCSTVTTAFLRSCGTTIRNTDSSPTSLARALPKQSLTSTPEREKVQSIGPSIESMAPLVLVDTHNCQGVASNCWKARIDSGDRPDAVSCGVAVRVIEARS